MILKGKFVLFLQFLLLPHKFWMSHSQKKHLFACLPFPIQKRQNTKRSRQQAVLSVYFLQQHQYSSTKRRRRRREGRDSFCARGSHFLLNIAHSFSDHKAHVCSSNSRERGLGLKMQNLTWRLMFWSGSEHGMSADPFFMPVVPTGKINLGNNVGDKYLWEPLKSFIKHHIWPRSSLMGRTIESYFKPAVSFFSNLLFFGRVFFHLTLNLILVQSVVSWIPNMVEHW